MLSLMIKVRALETVYYTDYGNFSEYQEELVVSDDVTEVEVLRKYLYSRKIYSDGGYHPLGLTLPDYPLIDMNDYTIPNFTSWAPAVPEQKEGRIIETKNTYHYQDALGIRYIHLYDLYGSYGAFRISEIDVLKNGTNLNYSVSCTSCSSEFAYYTNNNVVQENLSFIYNGGSLTIDLGTYQQIETLELKLHLFDMGDDVKRYSVAFTRVNSKTNPYLYQTYNSYFRYESLMDIKPQIHSVNNLLIGNLEYGPVQIASTPVPSSPLRLINEVVLYRYYDPLYHYYNWIVEYAPDYQSETTTEYPIVDQFHYKDYYRFKKRAKLILNEPLLIEQTDQQLQNFITETSEEYILETNLNYDVNGTYLVKFIYPTGTIEKEIVVDIAPPVLEVEIIDEVIEPKEKEEVIEPEEIKEEKKVKPIIKPVIKEKPKPVEQEKLVYEKEINESIPDESVVIKPTEIKESSNDQIIKTIRPMFIYLGIFLAGLIVIVKKRFNI